MVACPRTPPGATLVHVTARRARTGSAMSSPPAEPVVVASLPADADWESYAFLASDSLPLANPCSVACSGSMMTMALSWVRHLADSGRH